MAGEMQLESTSSMERKQNVTIFTLWTDLLKESTKIQKRGDRRNCGWKGRSKAACSALPDTRTGPETQIQTWERSQWRNPGVSYFHCGPLRLQLWRFLTPEDLWTGGWSCLVTMKSHCLNARGGSKPSMSWILQQSMTLGAYLTWLCILSCSCCCLLGQGVSRAWSLLRVPKTDSIWITGPMPASLSQNCLLGHSHRGWDHNLAAIASLQLSCWQPWSSSSLHIQADAWVPGKSSGLVPVP